MSKYGYPDSIEEAARLLDIVKPDWYKQVNILKLSMMDGTKCVLGQLYGQWWKGMHSLFGSTRPGDNYRASDTIFGNMANPISWVKQIEDRRGLSVANNLPTIQVNSKVVSITLSYGGISMEIPSEDIDFIIGKLQQAKGFTHVP